LITYFFLVCKELDDEFLTIARKYNIKAGSTLLLSLVHNGRFTIANIGDSAAMLLKQNGKMLKLTDEQTPDRDDEYNRIVRNNGFVSMKNDVARVDGILAVSRAIGDMQQKQNLIPESETYNYQIQPNDDLLILSSDGLYLVYSEQEVAKMVYELRK
jgi:protein phosphatase 1L